MNSDSNETKLSSDYDIIVYLVRVVFLEPP
jgi:hypothetical protein